MQIHTTARHCTLEPEDRAHAEQRLLKLEKFARDIHEAHLTVSVEKHRHVAEITLRLNHHEIVSREEAADHRAAVDLASDHLEEQLRRLKERRIDRKQRVARGADGRATPGVTATDGEPEADGAGPDDGSED